MRGDLLSSAAPVPCTHGPAESPRPHPGFGRPKGESQECSPPAPREQAAARNRFEKLRLDPLCCLNIGRILIMAHTCLGGVVLPADVVIYIREAHIFGAS